jgi:hypothetical protein
MIDGRTGGTRPEHAIPVAAIISAALLFPGVEIIRARCSGGACMHDQLIRFRAGYQPYQGGECCPGEGRNGRMLNIIRRRGPVMHDSRMRAP